MRSRLRWWITPITFAFGSLILDVTIVLTDYLASGRIALAAPTEHALGASSHESGAALPR